MAFDTVPWAIGYGAEVSEETARVFANIASGDSQGIALPGDLKVTALTVPGGAVQIAPGGVVIRNRQAPGQSYVGRAGTVTQVPIAPTGSSGPRSDLLIARVRDPDYAPWQPYTDPEEIAHGPYFEPFVISGVPSNTKFAEDIVTYSAEALARIDIPANTATITNAMITPLRRLANPRQWTDKDTQAAVGQTLVPADKTYRQFPANSMSTTVPRWATHALVVWTFATLAVTGSAGLQSRVHIGNLVGTQVSPFDYIRPPQFAGDVVDNRTHVAAELFDVRSLRGQTVQVQHHGARPGNDAANNVFVTSLDKLVMEVLYTERVV